VSQTGSCSEKRAGVSQERRLNCRVGGRMMLWAQLYWLTASELCSNFGKMVTEKRPKKKPTTTPRRNILTFT